MKRAEILLSLAGIIMATAYITGNPLVALLGTAIIAHYSMARTSFNPKIRIRRELPETGIEKEPIKSTIILENLSRANGSIKIQEKSKKVFAKELKSELKAFEKKYLTQTIVPQSRGRIPLKTEAIFKDEFNLFIKKFSITTREELTVFPSQKSIKEAIKEKKEVNLFTEAQKSLGIGTEIPEFNELREYLPGDDITKIDWKATSRLQKLIVRVLKKETPSNIYILINTDPKFRRELMADRIDYLVLILTQLIAYFRKFNHTIQIITYDEAGKVRSIKHSSKILEPLKELDLKGEHGIPPLKPSKIEGSRSFTKKILKFKQPTSNSGLIKATMKLEKGSYIIIIDDIGLHPTEILKAEKLLSKKGSKSVVMYLNPILFLNKNTLNKKTLEIAYQAYHERKKLKRRMMRQVKIIEVGPQDLLPKVVRQL